MNRLKFVVISVVVLVALLSATISVGQDGGFGGAPVTNLDSAIFPRTRIIEFDDRVAMLDTSTGELFRFRGDLSGSNARGTFVRLARPLAESTSGFLQLQQVAGATFLIDTVNGNVWILRQRGNSNASWIPVNVL
jgi:hypothetical protein